MFKFYLHLLLVLILFNSRLTAQDIDEDFLDFEFEFGLGYAESLNANLFNDSQGVRPGGAVAIQMAFRYHFNYNWSAGVHLMIVADEIRDYDPDLVLGFPSNTNISTSNVNFGLGGKYTFNLDRWQPHVFGGLGVAFGAMTTIEFEEPLNQFTGIAVDMGLGLGYMVSGQVMISSTLTQNYGLAWWKHDPSFNSINRQFDPSFWSLSLSVSYFFSEEGYY